MLKPKFEKLLTACEVDMVEIVEEVAGNEYFSRRKVNRLRQAINERLMKLERTQSWEVKEGGDEWF